MDEGTKADYDLITIHDANNERSVFKRVIQWLQTMDYESPYQISRLQHCLQTATRAFNDKASKEMIVAALLHDIGDELAPLNHSEYAATILKPYVSEKTHWIVEKHGEFQMYYYAHHLAGNRNLRDKYKNHKYYNDTLEFCEKWDQTSFDPNFKSLKLKDFEHVIRKIFSRKPYTF